MKLSTIIISIITAGFSSVLLPKLHDITIYPSNQSTVNIGYNNSDMKTNGEYSVIKELITPHTIVFDVGANRGEWSLAVLSMVPTINQIYAFEPIPTIFTLLKVTMWNKPVQAYQVALSDVEGVREFLYYSQNEQSSELSTFYTRPIVYNLLGILPERINVTCTTLDIFCFAKNIPYIDFLKIDTEGSELAVLKGAQQLLKTQRIKHIQFEYGGTYTDAEITLKQVITLLTHYDYVLFRIFNKGLIHIANWNDTLENYAYSNYIAVLKEHAYPFTVIDNL